MTRGEEADAGSGLSMDVRPMEVRGRAATFQVTYLNGTNAPAAIALTVRDAEDRLGFRIEPEAPVVVPAGGTSAITVHAVLRGRRGAPHPYELELRGVNLGAPNEVNPALIRRERVTYAPRHAWQQRPTWIRRTPLWAVLLPLALLVPVLVFAADRARLPRPTPRPVGQSGHWNLIFDDEFNGSSLDLSKWRPNRLGSSDTAITPPFNRAEVSCYDPAQVSEGNGELDLKAVARSCDGYSYASGTVESNGKFNFTHGYMEARIWTPVGSGMWPAFWSNGQHWPQDGEIDVLEAYGTDTSSYHYHYACGGDCVAGGSVDVPGATSGWHTYAADWEPGVITWYYDGHQVWQYTTGITSSPMYLIINLGLNSSSSAVPATMRVDYVRVWQHRHALRGRPMPASSSNISIRWRTGTERRRR